MAEIEYLEYLGTNIPISTIGCIRMFSSDVGFYTRCIYRENPHKGWYTRLEEEKDYETLLNLLSESEYFLGLVPIKKHSSARQYYEFVNIQLVYTIDILFREIVYIMDFYSTKTYCYPNNFDEAKDKMIVYWYQVLMESGIHFFLTMSMGKDMTKRITKYLL
jgi:hypothetical protein